jgi:hypothetical protein
MDSPTHPTRLCRQGSDREGPLTYCYGREKKAEAKCQGLTLDEAKRIATNIAKLPQLKGRRSPRWPSFSPVPLPKCDSPGSIYVLATTSDGRVAKP